MAPSAFRNALIARASEGISTAGVPPNGLSPATLTVRISSGFALVIRVQRRNAIEAAPSTMTARSLKHFIIRERDSGQKLLKIRATTPLSGSPRSGAARHQLRRLNAG